jgi:hypothetical protein
MRVDFSATNRPKVAEKLRGFGLIDDRATWGNDCAHRALTINE